VAQRDVVVALRHLLGHLAPQARALEHVCLVDARELAPSPSGELAGEGNDALDLANRQLTVRFSRYDGVFAENNAVADIWIRSGVWRPSGGAWQAVHFTDTQKTGYDGVATFSITDLAGWSDATLPASGVEYKFTVEAWATDLVGDEDAKAIDSDTFYFTY
jgi:hypothetical protein